MRYGIEEKIFVYMVVIFAVAFGALFIVIENNNKNVTTLTTGNVDQYVKESQENSLNLINDIAKESIHEQAEHTAKYIEFYIKEHSNATVYDLQNDTFFQFLAIHKVGKTGYTAVADYDTFINRFHPNPAIINTDLSLLSEKLPKFWAIFAVSRGGAVAEGFYDWQEADGSLRKKYMYIAPIGIATKDGTRLNVAATAYIDEFSEDLEQVQQKNIQLYEEYRTKNSGILAKNSSEMLGIFSIAIFIVLAVFYLMVDSIIRPIKKITMAISSIKKDEKIKLVVKSKDELGELFNEFNRMVLEIEKNKKNMKNYSKNLEKDVSKKTNELRKKIQDLERFNKVTIDREIRMIELKKQLKELKSKNNK